MSKQLLTAICFDGEDKIDELFLRLVQTQRSLEKRVVGVLQHRSQITGECHCSDMDLVTIGSNKIFRISQPLGLGSNGCRLDPGALAECSAFLGRELQKGCDLMVLNRFGKGESDGRGFRDLISTAISLQVPVIIGLHATYLSAWRMFCGDYGCELTVGDNQVENWVNSNSLVTNAA